MKTFQRIFFSLLLAVGICLLIARVGERMKSSPRPAKNIFDTEFVKPHREESRPAKPHREKAAPASAERIEGLEIPLLLGDVPEQIISRSGYTVSFNEQTRLANWVAYELTRAETSGDEERASRFLPDPEVRGAQAADADYRKSGYDRGHLAPAADMRWSAEAMHESFYFSNIAPQHPRLNRGDWKQLEEACRDWACECGALYIVCGPVTGQMQGGRIGRGGVVVPDIFYKVLLRRRGEGYESIGFLFRNAAGERPLRAYAVSVDSVERLAATDFFHLLPDSVEERVEARYDAAAWGL